MRSAADPASTGTISSALGAELTVERAGDAPAPPREKSAIKTDGGNPKEFGCLNIYGDNACFSWQDFEADTCIDQFTIREVVLFDGASNKVSGGTCQALPYAVVYGRGDCRKICKDENARCISSAPMYPS